jgi:hypothetical protein
MFEPLGSLSFHDFKRVWQQARLSSVFNIGSAGAHTRDP